MIKEWGGITIDIQRKVPKEFDDVDSSHKSELGTGRTPDIIVTEAGSCDLETLGVSMKSILETLGIYLKNNSQEQLSFCEKIIEIHTHISKKLRMKLIIKTLGHYLIYIE